MYLSRLTILTGVALHKGLYQLVLRPADQGAWVSDGSSSASFVPRRDRLFHAKRDGKAGLDTVGAVNRPNRDLLLGACWAGGENTKDSSISASNDLVLLALLVGPDSFRLIMPATELSAATEGNVLERDFLCSASFSSSSRDDVGELVGLLERRLDSALSTLAARQRLPLYLRVSCCSASSSALSFSMSLAF
jgi:hypothetical protein